MTELRRDEHGCWVDDETDEIIYLDDTDRAYQTADYEYGYTDDTTDEKWYHNPLDTIYQVMRKLAPNLKWDEKEINLDDTPF